MAIATIAALCYPCGFSALVLRSMGGAAFLAGLVILKLILTLAALPWVWMWITIIRPKQYDPSVVPDSMLPKVPKTDHPHPPPVPAP